MVHPFLSNARFSACKTLSLDFVKPSMLIKRKGDVKKLINAYHVSKNMFSVAYRERRRNYVHLGTIRENLDRGSVGHQFLSSQKILMYEFFFLRIAPVREWCIPDL